MMKGGATMEEKKRNRTIFYISFYEAIEEADGIFNDADCLELYRAIFNYAFFGTIPSFEGAKKLAWNLMEPNLRADRQRWLNGSNSPGAPIGNDNATKTTEKQPRNNRETTQPIIEREKEREKERRIIEIEEEKSIKKKSSSKKFTKPTIEEIEAYCQEKRFSIDATYFFDHYEANGWMVGKTPMKDWKATLRNWDRKNKQSIFNPESRPNDPSFDL